MTDYTLLDDLTERELQVIRLLGKGLTNTEIANQLYLAHSTVKWYVRQLNSKLDTANRDEIVEQAQKIGLLNDDSETNNHTHHLPYQTTPFIGRDTELAALHSLLNNPNIRLLTILAAGGMGKTRIALEAAEQQIDRFPDGVFFVPLQSLSDIDQIIPTIAKSLHFQFQSDGRNPKDQLLDFLANKCLLLLMDNWEHLLDGVGVLNDILEVALHVKILTTSREKLNLLSEAVYVLHGMTVPNLDVQQDALHYDATQLLIQTAKRIKSDWQVTPDTLADIIHICQLTEGMPLAILLAASWLDVYDFARIRQEIQCNTDFLATELRDVPQRQRSIRAIFDYTWDMLSPAEQQCFMKMSVFRGGCTPEAAEAITEATARTLQSLLNKALLLRSKDGRYDVHELLRQYAEAKLDEVGDPAATRHAHMHYYAELLYSLDHGLDGHHQREALDQIEIDFENMQTAWEKAILQRDAGQIAKMRNSFDSFFSYRSRWETGIAMIGTAIEVFRDSDDPFEQYVLGRCLISWGLLSVSMLRTEGVQQRIEEGIALVHQFGKLEAEAHGLLCLAHYYEAVEQFADQERILKQGLALSRQLDLKGDASWALYMLSMRAMTIEQFDSARQYALEGLELDRQSGDMVGAVSALNILANVETDSQIAETYLQEALTIARQLDIPMSTAFTMNSFADLAYQIEGNLEKAMFHYNDCLKFAGEYNQRFVTGVSLSALSRIAIARGHYNDAHQFLETCIATHIFPPSWSAVLTKLPYGLCFWGQGDYPTAVTHFLETFAVLCQSDSRRTAALSGMPFVLAYYNQPEKAVALTHALIRLHPRISHVPAWVLDQHAVWSEFMATLKLELGDDTYQQAWQHGESLSLEVLIQDLMVEFLPLNQ